MNTTNQIQIFSELVYEAGDIVELRRIKPDDPRSSFHLAGELCGLTDWLTAENAKGLNIYAGINPRRHRGGKSAKDVLLARVSVADFDGLTLAEADERRRKAGMPVPTLTIFSGHGCHHYWRWASAITDLAQWTTIQKGLIRLLGSDHKIHDWPRVMRMPGFVNVKAEPVPCEVTEYNPGLVYDLGEILPLLPKPPAEPPRPMRTGCNRIAGGGEVRRASRYVAKMDASIQGQHGSDEAFAAACEAMRFGLSADDAMHVLQTAFNPRCVPPWSERELAHKICDARKEVGSEFGSRLVDGRSSSPVRHPRFRMLASIGGGM